MVAPRLSPRRTTGRIRPQRLPAFLIWCCLWCPSGPRSPLARVAATGTRTAVGGRDRHRHRLDQPVVARCFTEESGGPSEPAAATKSTKAPNPPPGPGPESGCTSRFSRLRLEYSVPLALRSDRAGDDYDYEYDFQILQKDCKEPFAEGTEPFRTGNTARRGRDQRILELYAPHAIPPSVASSSPSPSGSPVVEFCVLGKISDPSANHGGEHAIETNLSVEYSFRATRPRIVRHREPLPESKGQGAHGNRGESKNEDEGSKYITVSEVRGLLRNSVLYMVVDRVSASVPSTAEKKEQDRREQRRLQEQQIQQRVRFHQLRQEQRQQQRQEQQQYRHRQQHRLEQLQGKKQQQYRHRQQQRPEQLQRKLAAREKGANRQ
ncbi:unnamed protein product [Pseudo-nitzschia multistriata]|uniref:Uncharacterized protein n=1 Tax=Pseudo-nitzschia multistriata TaxID=183589 RepID=A0A448Z433_9STRA|nr:unnamed protein product [Pseudo-nitzschia multistriata]